MVEQRSLVIGIPGFVAVGERSRTTEVLERLEKERKFHTLDFRYSGFRQEGKTIVCDFFLEGCLDELTTAVNQKILDKDVDKSRIGFYVSSVGAGILAYYLAREIDLNRIRPRCISSVSPLLDWKYFATSEVRAVSETLPEIDISSEYDEKLKIKRVLSSSGLVELKKISGVDILNGIDRHLVEVGVQTLYGINDRISAPVSIRGFHISLGGNLENLHAFDCGHNLPLSESANLAYDFFYNQLRD